MSVHPTGFSSVVLPSESHDDGIFTFEEKTRSSVVKATAVESSDFLSKSGLSYALAVNDRAFCMRLTVMGYLNVQRLLNDETAALRTIPITTSSRARSFLLTELQIV